MKVRSIIVHHSASRADRATLVNVDAWHRERGFRWSYGNRAGHIGYHYLIEYDGESASVQRGRPEEIPGAHCIGRNHDSLGVCLAGSFEESGWLGVPVEQRRVLIDLLANLCRVHDLHAEDVTVHREAHPGHTVCPGFDPEPIRDELRRVLIPIGPSEIG